MHLLKISIISLFTLLILIGLANKTMDFINGHIGTSYGTTAMNQCLNDPKIENYDNILIGTSVTRELTAAKEDFLYQNKNFYNCGISVPTTNLGVHYLFLNTLGEKLNLNGKNILIEVSLQTILKEEPSFNAKGFKSYLDFVPFETKLYLLKDYIYYIYKKGDISSTNNLLGLIKSLIFPINGIKFVSSNPKFEKRKNYYLNKKFDKTKPRQDHIDMFNKKFNAIYFLYRLEEIKKLAKKYGVDIKFLLVPTSEFYKTKMDINTINAISKIINHNNFSNTLDLRSLDKSEYFADCCHYNKYGQEALKIFMRKMDE
ncbi:MAG: hypothetical protein U9N59_15425 [Campylobacterota bacterium]|nr:hypothetical protein [Campylobacterota bacterium]